MRLKNLFFPIILVVSVAIFIGYIWPEIGNFKEAKEKKLVSATALQSIKDKRTAIETLSVQINKSSETESAVKNYLPENKVEERIINGVNFLTSDAGVSLVSISLSKSAVAAAQPAPVAPSNVPSGGGIMGMNPHAEKVETLENMQASIKISGDYEKIRIFIDQIEHMSIFNSIKSLSITPQGQKTENGENAGSSSLAADLVVDFGYLKKSKLSDNMIVSFKPELDNETISAMKTYISQKTPVLDVDANKGKINPFLP